MSRHRPAYGHLLAQLADDLTYDGFVAMAFVATTDEELEREKMYADADQSEGGSRRPDVVAELDRLAALDLVGVRGDDEIVMPPQRFPGASGFRELPLMRAALTPTGEALLGVLELDRIPGAMTMLERIDTTRAAMAVGANGSRRDRGPGAGRLGD